MARFAHAVATDAPEMYKMVVIRKPVLEPGVEYTGPIVEGFVGAANFATQNMATLFKNGVVITCQADWDAA